MGTVTQGGPVDTITEQPDAFEIGYTRDPDDALGKLERYEVELWSYSSLQDGDVLNWHRDGSLPYSADESYEIPFSPALRNGDYKWRARLRDRRGNWADWTALQDFTLAAEAPVLSDLHPSQDDSITLEVPAGLRFSLAYEDPADSPPRLVEAQLVEQADAEAWDEADYTLDALLWGYIGQPRSYDGERIVVRYSGRSLPPGGTYLWRIRAKNMYGTYSEWTGGQFTLGSLTPVSSGPVETVTDAWKQLWETGAIAKPVGVAYDPDNPTWLTVIDAKTRNLAVFDQVNQVVIQSDYIGDTVAYPAGLSLDPDDDTLIWLLRAPWTQGAGLSGNKLVALDRSDFSVVHNYSLTDNRWTAIKVSADWAYATNWDDGKIYRINKATGAVDSSWSITYDGEAQTKPTGIMVDGDNLYYFFYNDGSTKRFLRADEADPTTILDVTSTEGLAILGGEMDTTTHTEMFGDSDLLGKVWKFTLTEITYDPGVTADFRMPALTTDGDG